MDLYPFVEIVEETPKAWQLCMPTGEMKWFPKSQCKIRGSYVCVPEWLVERMKKSEAEVMEKNVIDLMLQDMQQAIELIDMGNPETAKKILLSSKSNIESYMRRDHEQRQGHSSDHQDRSPD